MGPIYPRKQAFVRREVSTAQTLRIEIIWDVAVCSRAG